METVTLTKKEYEGLKEKATIDWQIVEKIKRGLDDIKHGRITEWKPAK